VLVIPEKAAPLYVIPAKAWRKPGSISPHRGAGQVDAGFRRDDDEAAVFARQTASISSMPFHPHAATVRAASRKRGTGTS